MFALTATLAEPLLQMLAGGGGQLREEESGASLVAGPDHVGVAVQRDVRAGKHAAKRHVGIDGYRLARFHREPVLSDINADTRECAMFELDIDQRFRFIPRGFAPVRGSRFLSGLERFFDEFPLERTVKDAARARLEGLSSAGPRAAGHRQKI